MNERIEKEISLAEEKLGAAEHLFKGGFYRDAVSRAYYCMYHLAKALLALKNVHPKTHSGAIREFGLRFVKGEEVEEYYGKALRFAKEKREKSDYDFFVEISKEEAEAIIHDAETFLGRIKRAIEEMEGEKA